MTTAPTVWSGRRAGRRRGLRWWRSKTGKNPLAADQLEAYLDIAREQGSDALITVSNEIPPSADQHPTNIDKRKLRKIAMTHLSCADILSCAVLQKERRGVSDPDQAWILGELIRYLEHPKSGAMEFEDMGADWVPLREAVAAGTLRPTDRTIADVVARFDALLPVRGSPSRASSRSRTSPFSSGARSAQILQCERKRCARRSSRAACSPARSGSPTPQVTSRCPSISARAGSRARFEIDAPRTGRLRHPRELARPAVEGGS